MGNFGSWDEVKRLSSGYESQAILNKVKDSLLKVKNGEAVYERDSVLFDEPNYSWPLLTALLWMASYNEKKLFLIDYGGSLGSSYFQNLKMLSNLKEIRWNVVEQPSFVDVGRKFFQDDTLRFYRSIKECLLEQNVKIILLSSVLPYLEKPHEFLDLVVSHRFPFVVIDRTPIINKKDDRLTLQKVPPAIYKASYPAWFFNRDALLEHFLPQYELVAEFDALSGEMFLGDTVARDKGFIFKLKSI